MYIENLQIRNSNLDLLGLFTPIYRVKTNPVHGEWRGVIPAIQHYVIKFVSDLCQVGGFLRVLRFPSSIKLTAIILNIAKPTLYIGVKSPNKSKFEFRICRFSMYM
jgi:hypothetical protein